MQIQISRDGQTFGPYSIAQLQQHLESGHVWTTDQAWHEGAPEWLPITAISGLDFSRIPPPPPTKTVSALAITSLILGILSIVLWIIGWIFSIPAIITGHLAQNAIRKSRGYITGNGMALAGLIMGYIMTFIPILFLAGCLGLAALAPKPEKLPELEDWQRASPSSSQSESARSYDAPKD